MSSANEMLVQEELNPAVKPRHAEPGYVLVRKQRGSRSVFHSGMLQAYRNKMGRSVVHTNIQHDKD